MLNSPADEPKKPSSRSRLVALILIAVALLALAALVFVLQLSLSRPASTSAIETDYTDRHPAFTPTLLVALIPTSAAAAVPTSAAAVPTAAAAAPTAAAAQPTALPITLIAPALPPPQTQLAFPSSLPPKTHTPFPTVSAGQPPPLSTPEQPGEPAPLPTPEPGEPPATEPQQGEPLPAEPTSSPTLALATQPLPSPTLAPAAPPASPTLLPTTVPTSAPPPPATVLPPVESTGQLSFDYPLELVLDRDEILTLKITPDRPLVFNAASAAPAAAAKLLVEASPNDLAHKSAVYSIPIYAVMSAQVITPRADKLVILAGSEPKQLMDPRAGNFWTWSVVAKQSGEYRITLRVYGFNDLADADPVRVVVDDTRVMTVRDRPFPESLTRAISDNWSTFLGADGPIALLVGIGGLIIAFLGYRANRRSAIHFGVPPQSESGPSDRKPPSPPEPTPPTQDKKNS